MANEMGYDDEEFSLEDVYENATHEWQKATNCGGIESVVRETIPALEELEELVPMLPTVIDGGSCGNPHAAEMYARKDQLVGELNERFRAIKAYIPVMNAELERCDRNRTRILADMDRLNDPDPRINYEDAIRMVDDEVCRINEKRDEQNELTLRISATINMSTRKHTPGIMRREYDREKRKIERGVFPEDPSRASIPDELIAMGSLM